MVGQARGQAGGRAGGRAGGPVGGRHQPFHLCLFDCVKLDITGNAILKRGQCDALATLMRHYEYARHSMRN